MYFFMSDDVAFSFHTRHVIRIGQRLFGCIFTYFISRDFYLTLTRLWSYGLIVTYCLWYTTMVSLCSKEHISTRQRSFTKHIFGMQYFDYNIDPFSA